MTHLDSPLTYRITVRGKLDERWSDWFSGMQVSLHEAKDGTPLTTLVGPVADQAQLRGVLNRIWNLNLILVSLVLVEEEPDEDDC